MSRSGIFVLDFRNFVFDDLQLQFPALGNRRKFFNEFFQLFQLLLQLEDFQFGEARETQIENCLCLNFRQFKPRHELGSRIRGALRFFDDGDYLVDVADGDNQSFQDMASLFRLVQVEQRSSQNNLLLIFYIMADNFHQPQLLRLAVGNYHHVDAESHFQIGIFIEIREQLFDIRVLFYANDGAHARTV